MRKTISLRLSPQDAASEPGWKAIAAAEAGVHADSITGMHIRKRSLDARGRQAWYNMQVELFIDEREDGLDYPPFQYGDVNRSPKTVAIVGAGPAGLFAALRCIELGIRPIVLERGKDVRARRRDLAAMNKAGIVNPESNYCFGEGGAGTYSDGKLYTRSTKRGDVPRILQTLVHFGADPSILYEAHPHIGTNKLPQIIVAMREAIVAAGGEVRFDSKMVGFDVAEESLHTLHTSNVDAIAADACILATGHSARDIFHLLHAKGLRIEAKPFALGVRVEHPQSIIDAAQYQCEMRSPYLPPAAYSLVQQVGERGVFSFCMCPGGIIAPAATAPGEIVVNGWSPSKRNNPWANSGIVVNIDAGEWKPYESEGPLAALAYQAAVERACFEGGPGGLKAPAQRLEDFVRGRTSADLPACSYLPGLYATELRSVLPPIVHRSLQAGFREFGKKLRGYFTNDAVVVATESRTSSPVRIPRDAEGLHHPQVKNLYPCGEGAGYAGGIVSAALDGVRVAEKISVVYR